MAKEIREVVMKLNMKRGEIAEMATAVTAVQRSEEDAGEWQGGEGYDYQKDEMHAPRSGSRWDLFLDEGAEGAAGDHEDGDDQAPLEGLPVLDRRWAGARGNHPQGGGRGGAAGANRANHKALAGARHEPYAGTGKKEPLARTGGANPASRRSPSPPAYGAKPASARSEWDEQEELGFRDETVWAAPQVKVTHVTARGAQSAQVRADSASHPAPAQTPAAPSKWDLFLDD